MCLLGSHLHHGILGAIKNSDDKLLSSFLIEHIKMQTSSNKFVVFQRETLMYTGGTKYNPCANSCTHKYIFFSYVKNDFSIYRKTSQSRGINRTKVGFANPLHVGFDSQNHLWYLTQSRAT